MRPRFFFLPAMLLLCACSSEIYLRDGVTDGDTFYLAQRALVDNDPVLQSWVAYSLARSSCQLEIGGPNPARNHSYDCERRSRAILAETWSEKRTEMPGRADRYLDDLVLIRDAGFLDEYVARTFGRRGWDLPNELDLRAYRYWRKQSLRRHRAETRIVGSWNYAHRVGPQL